jgi:Spy/CpxP family protein refolding chaperone
VKDRTAALGVLLLVALSARPALSALSALSAISAMSAMPAMSATSPAAQSGGQPGGRQGRSDAGSAAAPAPPGEPTITPAEIQRMFDSYALMQAQDQLKITDEQFPQFLTRFKALQDIRRQALQERARRIQELRRQLNGPQPDDAVIREHIKALQDLDVRSQNDIRKAYDAIDQVLDLRQQAKFRVFEENMERRKLELVMRARQATRPK